MSFWLELHCDKCHSDSNFYNPVSGKTGNLRKQVLELQDTLRLQALTSGWICATSGEWFCPRCQGK
jgi:hypothetical protein